MLRKAIALGGRSGSTELRDWATRELQGYGPDHELPPYRKITAPLEMDAATMHGIVKGQAISSWQLPDFARETITDDLQLRMGVAEIERIARQTRPGDVVRLGPPRVQDVVVYMNSQEDWSGHIRAMLHEPVRRPVSASRGQAASPAGA